MTASKYEILQDFLASTDDPTVAPDVIAQHPWWIIVIEPFRTEVTFRRSLMASQSNDSTEAATTAPTIVIDSDCSQMQASSGKGSYVSSLTATLFYSGINYLKAVKPGDWCLAWIVNSEEQAQDIKSRISRGEACNGFDDGLRFVGRVQSVRQNMNQNPAGPRSERFQLQAMGFKELDSSIFYDPYLAENQKSIGQYLAKLGLNINKLFDQSGGGISINLAMPTMLDLLMGTGVAPRYAAPGGIQIATGLTASSSTQDQAPYAYLVPEKVGKYLGKTSKSKAGGILSYADLLELLFGVQKYSGSNVNASFGFTPTGVPSNTNRRFTGVDMLGIFTPTTPQFDGKSVWTVLNQFLNPVINEMYTCLRVNAEGSVVPTVVVRQLPFSSPYMPEIHPDIDMTPFLTLPRWSVHPALVQSFDLGTSDTTRFNFIHAYGESAMAEKNNSLTAQIVRNPPIRDDQDIKRSGLRPYMTTVACSHKDTIETGPRRWMELAADFLMGQHLTLNGSLSMVGVPAPICPGDNLEFNGAVFHIESVVHACGIDPSGKKSWNTTVAVTHGLSNDESRAAISDTQSFSDSGMYAAMQDRDQQDYAPSVNQE